MDPRYAETRDRYVAELRGLMPDILDWWANGASDNPDAPNDFEKRWPAGPVAHPRILEVVRRYFLLVDALNTENRVDSAEPLPSDPESEWGVEPPPKPRDFVRPIDIVVNDLERVAPDIYGVMAALVFVPVGEDPDGEPN